MQSTIETRDFKIGRAKEVFQSLLPLTQNDIVKLYRETMRQDDDLRYLDDKTQDHFYVWYYYLAAMTPTSNNVNNPSCASYFQSHSSLLACISPTITLNAVLPNLTNVCGMAVHIRGTQSSLVIVKKVQTDIISSSPTSTILNSHPINAKTSFLITVLIILKASKMKPQDLSKRQAAKIIDAAQQDIADRKEKLPSVHRKFDRNLLYAQIESRQAIIKRLNAIHFATILLIVFVI